MLDLGSLGYFSESWAVNDGGKVVGYSAIDANYLLVHAFSWTWASGMVDLGTLGGNHSLAVAVNRKRQTVANLAGARLTRANLKNVLQVTLLG
jgi:probable HAF family extracellular repeat protein